MDSQSQCRQDNSWNTDCRFRWEKIGDVSVKSKFNFCTSPAVLDTSVRMRQHVWKLSFSPKNTRESKLIGLEYWPIRVHVNFVKDESTSIIRQNVSACMEPVKSGETFCFFNASVPEQHLSGRSQFSSIASRYNDCDHTKSAISRASIPFFTVICLLLTILSVTTISCVIFWRRRVRRRAMKRCNRKENCESVLSQEKTQENVSSSEAEGLPKPMDFEHDDDVTIYKRQHAIIAKSPDRLTVSSESKFVQTSMISLFQATCISELPEDSDCTEAILESNCLGGSSANAEVISISEVHRV